MSLLNFAPQDIRPGSFFIMYANISEKKIISYPDKHTYMYVSREKKQLLYENFFVRTKWMIP